MIATFTAIAVLLIIKGSEAGLYDLFTPESRLSGFIMEKISPIGMVMCVKECSKRRFCASLNFSRKRLECELSHSDVSTNPSNMVSDPDFIYIGRNQIPDEYFDSKTASCPAKGSSVNTATGSKCVKSDCPSDHPDTNVTTVKVTSTKVGTVLNYTCNSDTSIILTSTCRGNGTWTSSASLCSDVPVLPNIALGKSSAQSSTYQDYNAAYAVDGNRGTNFFVDKCTRTMEGDFNPWWKLDLQAVYSITSVRILNRGIDQYGDSSFFLLDVTVTVGLTESDVNTPCGFFAGPGTASQLVVIDCPTLPQGRFVKISKTTQALTLCEVDVFGVPF